MAATTVGGGIGRWGGSGWAVAGETLATVVGNLTADPELRFTAAGIPVAGFTVASTPRTYDRDRAEWVDGEPLFLRCSLWRQAAENAANCLTKASASSSPDGSNSAPSTTTRDSAAPSSRWMPRTSRSPSPMRPRLSPRPTGPAGAEHPRRRRVGSRRRNSPAPRRIRIPSERPAREREPRLENHRSGHTAAVIPVRRAVTGGHRTAEGGPTGAGSTSTAALLGAGALHGRSVGLLGRGAGRGHVDAPTFRGLFLVDILGLAGCPAAWRTLLQAWFVAVQTPPAGEFGPHGFPSQFGLRREARGFPASLLFVQCGLPRLQVHGSGGGRHGAGSLGNGSRGVVPPGDVVSLGDGARAGAVAVGLAAGVDQAPQPPRGKAAHVVHPGHASGQQLDQFALG